MLEHMVQYVALVVFGGAQGQALSLESATVSVRKLENVRHDWFVVLRSRPRQRKKVFPWSKEGASLVKEGVSFGRRTREKTGNTKNRSKPNCSSYTSPF